MQAVPRPYSILRLSNFATVAAAVLIAVIIIAQSVITIFRFHDVFPYYDMVFVDYQYFFGKAQDFWLLADNEHRPLFAMPLYWIDLVIFADQEIFLVVCNLVLAAAIVAVLWRAVFGATTGNRAVTALACALVATVMFWLANSTNLSWAKQVHVYLSTLTLMLAFQYAAIPKPVSVRNTVVISTWLFVSTFSFASGIIGFPAVAAIAIMRRWNMRAMAVLAIAFLVSVAVYAGITGWFGFLRDGQSSVQFAPDQTLLFALTYIAAPVIHAVAVLTSDAPALLAGRILAAVGLVIFAWRFVSGFWRPVAALEAWALLLISYTVGNALETAVARAARFGMQGALEYRYMIGEVPFWIGLLLLAVPLVCAGSHRRLFLAAFMALVVEAGLLKGQQSEVTFLRLTNARDWQGAIAAIVGVSDVAFFRQHVWPDSSQVVAVIDGLRARHWSVFAWPEADWLGQSMARFTVTAQRCSGNLDALVPITGGGSLVKGWAADKAVPDWAVWIVLADTSGTITGLAHGGVLDFDAAEQTKSFFSGWTGYARNLTPGAGSLAAYLVLPGNRACPLGPA